MFVDLVNPEPLPSFKFLVTDIALSRLKVDLVVVVVVEVGPRKLDVAPEALLGSVVVVDVLPKLFASSHRLGAMLAIIFESATVNRSVAS